MPRVALVLALVFLGSLFLREAGHLDASAIKGDPEVKDLGLAHFRHVVRAIQEHNGSVWVGTYGSGLYEIGPNGMKQYTRANSPLAEDRVNVLGSWRGELWIGTCAGFSVMGEKGWRRQTTADGLADDVYHSVLPVAGDLWVGTAGKGVTVFEGGRWRTLGLSDGLTDGWINALAAGPSGEVWVAGGVRVFKQAGRTFVEQATPWEKAPAAPTSLAVRGSEVWVGSAFGGLVMYQSGLWYRPPARFALGDRQVNALAVDREQQLWVGTNDGIFRYSPELGWKRYGITEGLADANVRVLHCAPSTGRIWAGSFVDGWVYARDPARDRFEPVMRAGLPVQTDQDRRERRRQ